MSKKAYVFEAAREGYSIDQLRGAVTIGELREFLNQIEDDDALFVLSHDGGYTYGSLSRGCMVKRETEGEYGTEWEDYDELRIDGGW
jgi:hypothetical protein